MVVEPNGTSVTYAYDLVGNHTEVRVNDRLVEHCDYNAANQVLKWDYSYDAAGNLEGDSRHSYQYDALNRLIKVDSAIPSGSPTQYNYNGDGVLVSQTPSGGTNTRYAQDLAAALPQVLQTQGGRTQTHLYGVERLATVSAETRTWGKCTTPWAVLARHSTTRVARLPRSTTMRGAWRSIRVR
jgi:YD repeat-containing protein